MESVTTARDRLRPDAPRVPRPASVTDCARAGNRFIAGLRSASRARSGRSPARLRRRQDLVFGPVPRAVASRPPARGLVQRLPRGSGSSEPRATRMARVPTRERPGEPSRASGMPAPRRAIRPPRTEWRGRPTTPRVTTTRSTIDRFTSLSAARTIGRRAPVCPWVPLVMRRAVRGPPEGRRTSTDDPQPARSRSLQRLGSSRRPMSNIGDTSSPGVVPQSNPVGLRPVLRCARRPDTGSFRVLRHRASEPSGAG
jgi:hypothetical protein